MLVIPLLISDCTPPYAEKEKGQKYNVLFIAIDDLRPVLGCYGDPVAVTPNIDGLASNGMVFLRAYCQQAVCAPSRASIMTGLGPDNIRVWDLQTHFRENIPDVVTLPQYFKKLGYHSREVGKIYHDPLKAKDPLSWSAPSSLHVTKNGHGQKYVLDENCTGKMKAAATEMADVPDTSYIDGKVCHAAIEILNEIKDSTFFLAVGFRRPHLPFSSPAKYWDLYKPEELPPIKNPASPAGVPEIALHNWKELRGYTDMPLIRDVGPEEALRLRWGYYAAVSYIDAQIGKLVLELKQLNLEKNTVIVLWADHGYHLGEHNLWCKITNFELDTRVPLIICLPDCQQNSTFPEDYQELRAEAGGRALSIDFPASASGSVNLRMECRKYSRGTISFYGQSGSDSIAMVFNYPFDLRRQYYPNVLIPGKEHDLKLKWDLLNARLQVFLDSSLQTIRLAETDKILTINRITIKNMSNRPDSSSLNILFTRSDIVGNKFSDERIRIVAFGNSTTAFRSSITGVYTQRLPDMLFKAGIANIVFNEGIPGSHTGHLSDNHRHNVTHGLDRFESSVLSKDPDVVIICFGLNDSWIDEGQINPRISLENYQENLSYMIRVLKENNILTILMTPNAIGDKYEEWRYEKTSRYSGIVCSLAQKEKIPLIDQWKLFEEYGSDEGQEIDDLLLDGMHPNDMWHEQLSVILSNIIVEHYKKIPHD